VAKGTFDPKSEEKDDTYYERKASLPNERTSALARSRCDGCESHPSKF
jgi:hypothetical protein